MKFKDELTALMHRADVTLEELAAESGVSSGTIWAWRCGRHEPRRHNRLAVMRALNDIITRKEPPVTEVEYDALIDGRKSYRPRYEIIAGIDDGKAPKGIARIEVPGGWLIIGHAGTTTFVPDRDHRWALKYVPALGD